MFKLDRTHTVSRVESARSLPQHRHHMQVAIGSPVRALHIDDMVHVRQPVNAKLGECNDLSSLRVEAMQIAKPHSEITMTMAERPECWH